MTGSRASLLAECSVLMQAHLSPVGDQSVALRDEHEWRRRPHALPGLVQSSSLRAGHHARDLRKTDERRFVRAT
jgi:hypothetical protein